MPEIDMEKFPRDLQGEFWAFAYQEGEKVPPSYRVYLGPRQYMVTDDIGKLREIQDLICVSREQIENLTIFFSNRDLRPINEQERAQIRH